MRPGWPAAALLLLSLSGCRSGEDSVPEPYRRVEVPRALLAQEEARLRGRATYLQHCAICHGEAADGRGVRRILSSQPVDFTDPSWRQQTSPRRVYFVIREGLQGTAMAAWRVLDEEESWDLVAYVLSVGEEER